MTSLNPHSHLENPNRPTGALIVMQIDESGQWMLLRITEYSFETGWDVPPKENEYWLYEDDIVNLIG